MAMKNLLLLILFLLLLSTQSFAETYWMSPTGAAANLAACSGATPLSGVNACSYDKANGVAVVAGDTVYYRAGTYSISGVGTTAILPSNSGTSGSKITFSSYNSEAVLFEGDFSNNQYGIQIEKHYIVINDLHFKDLKQNVKISGGNYNEIKYCEFYHQGEATVTDYAYRVIYLLNASTHNWIHHNSIHTVSQYLHEGSADGISIGGTGHYTCNNNTVENNLIYSIGHTLSDDYGMYNVWKNNIGHNEGWKTNDYIYGTATGGSSSTLVDTNTNFVTAGVQIGWYIFPVYNHANYATTGVVTNVATNTLTYDSGGGSFLTPTFANGIQYTVGAKCSDCTSVYGADPVGHNPGNGKFGHRNFAMTGETVDTYRYSLFEGNRSGYSAHNRANGAGDGFTLGSPGNIIRYNAFFGTDGPGINLKSYGTCAASGCNNRIYNNTIYKNGQSWVGQGNSDPICAGIQQYSANSASNVIKNNIFFQNTSTICVQTGDYVGTVGDQTWASNLCDATDVNKGCTIVLDPKFIDTNMTDMTSQDILSTGVGYTATALPNLRLQASSPAVDGGTYLTQANGAGSNSITLVVNDALYFQDGTWGSSLAKSTSGFGGTFQPDQIAIGTVTDVVTISSVNYATNTITLASPMTWSNGANIWLYKNSSGTVVLYGSAPDHGAYEYTPLPIVDQTLKGTTIRGGTFK